MASHGGPATENTTMAKPSEQDDRTVALKGNITVKLCYGTKTFRVPPFLSINSTAREKATALNLWEKAVLEQMHMKVPVAELLSQLDD
jgi:hypothetical protein